jgi:hypothetical protein
LNGGKNPCSRDLVGSGRGRSHTARGRRRRSTRRGTSWSLAAATPGSRSNDEDKGSKRSNCMMHGLNPGKCRSKVRSAWNANKNTGLLDFVACTFLWTERLVT